MARRPRLNLTASYFKDSYEAELRCLDAQIELVKLLIENQVKIAREQNKLLQEQLGLAYTLANQYESNKFKYTDAEALLQAIMKENKEKRMTKAYTKMMTKKAERDKADEQII